MDLCVIFVAHPNKVLNLNEEKLNYISEVNLTRTYGIYSSSQVRV